METWETLYKRKRQEQRETRGARVRYQQLRQEIADAAIIFCDTRLGDGVLDAMANLMNKREELRALEEQHPNVKEGM